MNTYLLNQIKNNAIKIGIYNGLTASDASQKAEILIEEYGTWYGEICRQMQSFAQSCKSKK